MRAVDQWGAIQADLPDAWEEARLAFTVEDSSAVSAAAAVLAPLGPGRAGNELRFHVRRSGAGSAQTATNLLGRLDRKRIWGTLALVDTTAAAAPTRARELPPEPVGLLAQAWDSALSTLAPGWSDLMCELELDSSDYLPRAALLGAPLNPTRVPGEIALRFRVSGRKGYGVSPGMARRCLERMDAEPITGRLSVAHALSDTDNVGTQGPVWRIAGRSV
jgi:hypothetical protein